MIRLRRINEPRQNINLFHKESKQITKFNTILDKRVNKENRSKFDSKQIILNLKKKNFSIKEIELVLNFLKTNSFFSNKRLHIFISEISKKQGKLLFLDLISFIESAKKQLKLNTEEDLHSFLDDIFITQSTLSFEKFKALKKYGFEKFILNYESSFLNQRIKDSLVSKRNKKKIKKTHTIKNENEFHEYNSMMIYKDNFVYRLMSKKQFSIWEKLFSRGLPVEEIIELDNKDNWVFREFNKRLITRKKEEKKYLEEENHSPEELKNLLNKYNKSNFVVVKSRNSGVTGETLFNSSRFKEYPIHLKLNILKQLCVGITKMWDSGYCHTDLKPGNYAIEFISGQPKVRIIDFDKAIPRDPEEITYEKEALVNYIDTQIQFNIPRVAKKKLIQYLERKASAYKDDVN